MRTHWRRWAIAGAALSVVAAALVLVGVTRGGSDARAQGTSQTPASVLFLAEKSGLSVETIEALETAALGVAADKGTAAGYLDADQAANLRALDPGQVLDNLLAGAAAAAQMSQADLMNGLYDGKSLSEMAAANGVDAQALKAGLLPVLMTEIVKLSGIIGSDSVATMLPMVPGHLDELINARVPQDKAWRDARGPMKHTR